MNPTKQNMIIGGVLLAVAGGIVGGVDGYEEGGVAKAQLWAAAGVVIGSFAGAVVYCIRTFSIGYLFTMSAIALVSALIHVALFE